MKKKLWTKAIAYICSAMLLVVSLPAEAGVTEYPGKASAPAEAGAADYLGEETGADQAGTEQRLENQANADEMDAWQCQEEEAGADEMDAWQCLIEESGTQDPDGKTAGTEFETDFCPETYAVDMTLPEEDTVRAQEAVVETEETYAPLEEVVVWPEGEDILLSGNDIPLPSEEALRMDPDEGEPEVFSGGLMELEMEYVPFGEIADEIYSREEIGEIANTWSAADSRKAAGKTAAGSKDAFGISPQKDAGEGLWQDEVVLASEYYESPWEQYGTYYIYNRLTQTDKEVWDQLNVLCSNVLESGEYRNNTGFLEIGMTSKDHLRELVYMFRYSNPQYFYLKNAITFSYTTPADPKEDIVYYAAIQIYDGFKDGAARQAAAEQFFGQLAVWITEVQNCGSELEKVIKMQDLICDKVEYDSEFASASDDEQKEMEKTAYTQSAYSAMCMDRSVCAGYAQAFELLSNAIGIDALAVTSPGHEWNKVRVEGGWYNIDCTWADKSTYVWHKYTLKNDAYYESDNASHIMNPFWRDYVPRCVLNSTFNGKIPAGTAPEGTIPELSMLPAPEIILTRDSSMYQVDIICGNQDAVIYYTLDGRTPDSSFSKSAVFEDVFLVNRGITIRAVAALDGYRSSEISMADAFPPSHYIFYDLDGGRNSDDNPLFFYEGDDDKIVLSDPVREGYRFKGWYKDEQRTKKITEITKPGTEDIKIYASWELEKYEIIFDYGTGRDRTEAYYGEFLTPPELESKEGYAFEGWFVLLEEGRKKWDFGTDPVRDHMTLTAVWTFVGGSIRAEDLEELARRYGVQVSELDSTMIPEGLWLTGVTDKIYNGQKKTCSLRVYYGVQLLDAGRDYTVKYANNVKAGTAKVTVKGKGKYKGSVKGTFQIWKGDISRASAENITAYYTADVVKGKTTVTFEEDGQKITLKEGKDFTYEYPGTDKKKADYDETAFRELGSYKVILHGKGNFTGTLTIEENIVFFGQTIQPPAQAPRENLLGKLLRYAKKVLRHI